MHKTFVTNIWHRALYMLAYFIESVLNTQPHKCKHLKQWKIGLFDANRMQQVQLARILFLF